MAWPLVLGVGQAHVAFTWRLNLLSISRPSYIRKLRSSGLRRRFDTLPW